MQYFMDWIKTFSSESDTQKNVHSAKMLSTFPIALEKRSTEEEKFRTTFSRTLETKSKSFALRNETQLLIRLLCLFLFLKRCFKPQRDFKNVLSLWFIKELCQQSKKKKSGVGEVEKVYQNVWSWCWQSLHEIIQKFASKCLALKLTESMLTI